MGWYVDLTAPTIVWRRRAAISVDIAGGGPYDVEVTIPPEWDEFWDVIDASGTNIRAVWYDSATKLAYAIDNGAGGSFVGTSRVGRLRLDGVVVPAATAVLCLWLYFDPSTTAASGAVAVTMTSTRNGYLEQGTPGQHRLAHMPAQARSTKPRKIIQKTVLEQVFVWIRLDGALQQRQSPGYLARVYEEPLYATMTVANAAGTDQTSMYDTDKIRFVWSDRGGGEMWLRIRVKAGTTATRYTAVVLTRTILPNATTAEQQLETRVGIDVVDSLES